MAMPSSLLDLQSILLPIAVRFSFLLLLSLASYIVYFRFFHPLARVPGPFLASVSKLWIVSIVKTGNFHAIYPRLHEKYGPVVRTGPNLVSVAEAAVARKVFASQAGFTKSDFFKPFQGARKFDITSERNEKIHGAQRRLIARAYALETMKDLEPYIENLTRVYFDKMDAAAGSIVNFSLWSHFFAVDAAFEITFSKRYGLLDAGQDDGLLSKIDTMIQSAAVAGLVPWLWVLTDYLRPIIGQVWAVDGRNSSLRDFALKHITARIKGGSDHQDMLGKLLDVHERKPDEFEMADVVSMSATNILAGGDTTSITMRSFVYHLLKSPAWKARLLAELDAHRAAGSLSDPPAFDEVRKLPVFQACLSESMRMHHIIGTSFQRVVPAAGLVAGDHFLPQGTVVELCPHVINFDKAAFGEDANVYNPARWLEAEGRIYDLNRSNFTFGGGSRTCLGRHVAEAQMFKLLPALFLRYDIELVDPNAQWTVKTHFFADPVDLNIRMTPRASKAA